MEKFDETGPNTHTRRYRVSSSVAIGAMIVFAILSILLLSGLMFGSDAIKVIADKALPWSLLAFAVACVAMIVANKRTPLKDNDPVENSQ